MRILISMRNWRAGFTMIELLVVVAILGAIMVSIVLSYQTQMEHGYDGRRKADLSRMKAAFEDYYNDHGCYPPVAAVTSCGQNLLSPYLTTTPCDPKSKMSYGYTVDPNCHFYALFAKLDSQTDPDSKAIGCSPNCGGTAAEFNFMVSNDSIARSTVISQPVSTPVPNLNNKYACDPLGNCQVYDNPAANGCPITFSDPQSCMQGCTVQANRCGR